MEIFSTYGTIKSIDMPPERGHAEFSRGFCYIEYDKPEEAENAVKFMDGGKIKFDEKFNMYLIWFAVFIEYI